MSTDKASSYQGQDGEGSIATGVVLLTLPWLRFAQKTLETVREGLQKHKGDPKDGGGDYSLAEPVKHLVAHELQAFLMVFDRSRRLREALGEDFEDRLAEACSQLSKKVAAGAVNLIEAQEIVLDGIIDVLQQAKNGEQPKNRPTKR
jgi:hypothetical protein